MSNLPSRTRRPTDTTTTRDNKSEGDNVALQRTSRSPSRLPVKPSTRPPPPPRASIGKPTTSGLQRLSSNHQSNPPTNTEPVKQDRSRPPITQSRHLRNASANSLSSGTRAPGPGHARTKSSSTISSASTALRPPPIRGSTILTAPTTLRPPIRGSTDDQASRSIPTESHVRRPAFSTLQQHFSPAKNLAPKPHPAAFLAPPSPSKLPSNIVISAETAKLQNELLQLHLLHKGAAEVEKEWRASAKRKLGAQFQSVVERTEALVALELEETSKINAAALEKWQGLATPGWGFEEKLQVLDEVITGVWNLGESGGKYARVVRKFERWLTRCQDVLEARTRDDRLEDEICFLEELDVGWKDDCLNIGRKLETWRDYLKDLVGSLEGDSSLATVVDGCRSLVRGMLMELSIMGQIERDAVRMELEWIRSMNDDDTMDDTPVAGAVWRSQ